MTDLPPLPPPDVCIPDRYHGDEYAHSDDQIRAYGAACAAAERERLMFELRVMHERAQGRHNYYLCAVQEIEAAIRARETP